MTQHTSVAAPTTSRAGFDAPPEPLGPDSLTWKYFGDWRGMLQGPWAGSMQNMHPQLGAAVEQHSTFFRERWPRLLRSLYPIGGVVFDGDRVAEFVEKPPLGEGWINGGFFVLNRRVLDYIGGDDTVWERGPLEQLARDGELMAYRHDGFWQAMDNLREKHLLEELWQTGNAPWKVKDE